MKMTEAISSPKREIVLFLEGKEWRLNMHAELSVPEWKERAGKEDHHPTDGKETLPREKDKEGE
ncbi:MAG: hypothetical protein LBF76_02675 [Holosporales bacterium]|nr:hypothetical protein [Holosporales bacterium]